MHVQRVTGPLVLRGDWGMTGLTSHFGYPGVRKYSTRVAGDRQTRKSRKKTSSESTGSSRVHGSLGAKLVPSLTGQVPSCWSLVF